MAIEDIVEQKLTNKIAYLTKHMNWSYSIKAIDGDIMLFASDNVITKTVIIEIEEHGYRFNNVELHDGYIMAFFKKIKNRGYKI